MNYSSNVAIVNELKSIRL